VAQFSLPPFGEREREDYLQKAESSSFLRFFLSPSPQKAVRSSAQISNQAGKKKKNNLT
jgi:hypothetical protein